MWTPGEYFILLLLNRAFNKWQLILLTVSFRCSVCFQVLCLLYTEYCKKESFHGILKLSLHFTLSILKLCCQVLRCLALWWLLCKPTHVLLSNVLLCPWQHSFSVVFFVCYYCHFTFVLVLVITVYLLSSFYF
jgi:hypothetical protein